MTARGGRSDPATATRASLALLGGFLLFASTSLVALPVPPAGGALAVSASSWVSPAGPWRITLDQRGLLAGRHLAVDVFVDQNLVGRITTRADRTRTRFATPDLAPGRHDLMVKTGREVARTEFRVISWSWLVGGGALLLSGLGAGLWIALGRRRRVRVA